MIRGLTSGCFDLIHVGHVQYLQRCRTQCDILFVGVDSDEMVKRAKGPTRPVIPFVERLALINALGCVDNAIPLVELADLHRLSISLCITVVFKHAGFREIDNVVGVTGTNAQLIIVPDVPGLVSTTEIITRVNSIQ